MKFIAIALISVFTFGAATTTAQEPGTWHNVAAAMPLGSKVKIETIANKRITGTLIRVDDTSMMVKRNTRRPEPAVIVPYNEMSRLERDQPGNVNLAKAILIGAGVGAGVILTMFAIALQLD